MIGQEWSPAELEQSRLQEEREDAARDESQDYRAQRSLRLAPLGRENAYRRIRARCMPLFDVAANSTPRLQDAAALLAEQIISTSIKEMSK